MSFSTSVSPRSVRYRTPSVRVSPSTVKILSSVSRGLVCGPPPSLPIRSTGVFGKVEILRLRFYFFRCIIIGSFLGINCPSFPEVYLNLDFCWPPYCRR